MEQSVVRMRGSEKKELSRKRTTHTLGEVLHELGVEGVDDDYESSDEEKEDFSLPICAPVHHSPQHHHHKPYIHSSPLMPTSMVPSSSYRQVSNAYSNSRPSSRPVSRPNSFHMGSPHPRQEAHHMTVADVFDVSKLSEEEQVNLTLKLSEQESKYGINMFDELRTFDPAEIKTLESYGYNFGQAVERIFNEHHDATQEVIHNVEDASLIVEVVASYPSSGKFVNGSNSQVKYVPSGISAHYNDHSPHGPAAYLDSLHKPNSLKTRRHSGIIHHIEERLGRSLEIHHDSDSAEFVEHQSLESINISMSKSFMDNFHKPNVLKDRRHSGIMHVIEAKHCESDETEHKADTSSLTPDQHRSFFDSFHKPNASRNRKHSGDFHSEVELKKEDTVSNRPDGISRDNSLSGEVTFSTTTPRSAQILHTNEIADRRSGMRTPPPPDAIHHVNLLDRKQSGIRAHHNRQISGASDSFTGFATAAFESDKSRSERRKTSGTPTSDTRYHHNGFDNNASAHNERKTSVNLIDEMLDPSQLSEEEQLALSIKLSEQEAKYGTNMFEELKQIDPSEIETLESFGYDFSQAVEMIFKEHHDVPQEIVHSQNGGYMVLPQDTALQVESQQSSKVENNPLRRRPSNADLLASMDEINPVPQADRLSRKMSNPLMLNPFKIENDHQQASHHHSNLHGHHFSDHNPHNNHSGENRHHHHHHHHHQGSHHKDQHSLHHLIAFPSSNGLLDNPLRRRPSNADLMEADFPTNPKGSLEIVPKELQRHPSNSFLENPLRRHGSKTEFLEENVTLTDHHAYQTIPNSSTYYHKYHSHNHHHNGSQNNHHHNNDIPYDLQSLTSTQTLEAIRQHENHNNHHHNHKSHYHHGQHHHNTNEVHRPHYNSEEYQYLEESYQQHQYSPPPSEKHHHRHHRSDSHPQYPEEFYPPYPQHHHDFQYSPPPQPSISQVYHQHHYLSQSPYQHQPLPVSIERRLSNSSSHSFYEDDNNRNGRIPQITPERSFGNGNYLLGDNLQQIPPHEKYMDAQLYQQQQPPHPQKSLTHRPSAHNMVPVRVESYFEVTSSNVNYSSSSNYSSHINGNEIFRSSSQELHRSRSQSTYEQQPMLHPAPHHTQGGMDHYSLHPSYHPSVTSYDSFDHPRSQQQYSPVPSLTPLTPTQQYSQHHLNNSSQNNQVRSSRGSLSQPPSNIIEEMRIEALSRLSEDEQIRLSMLVSKQEEVHGMNMFDSLEGGDQPEIDYWMSLGYKFEKVVLFMFQRRFDARVTHPDR